MKQRTGKEIRAWLEEQIGLLEGWRKQAIENEMWNEVIETDGTVMGLESALLFSEEESGT